MSTHEVALASAGHLPPLVCGGDGASLVQAKPGSPIGISGGAAFEPTLLTTAVRGTLIAYTDGLVERRGETLDTGLKRLLQTRPTGAAPPSTTCSPASFLNSPVTRRPTT